jgi:hypothetical protein
MLRYWYVNRPQNHGNIPRRRLAGDFPYRVILHLFDLHKNNIDGLDLFAARCFLPLHFLFKPGPFRVLYCVRLVARPSTNLYSYKAVEAEMEVFALTLPA